MYTNFLKTLTGLSILMFTACTGTRTISSVNNSTSSVAITKQNVKQINKKPTVIGPPEYNPDTANSSKSSPIIEKGGKYVYITPAYTRIKPEMGQEKFSPETLQQKVHKIKKFAAANNYDTAVAFFVDMQVKSGRERFFVVNMANDSIIKRGLVAHGKGNEKFTFDRKFSNGAGSNCSSLGVYKIGKAYDGAFGLSYKLYGLNKTNSNALKRYVVLHSMGSIPEAETNFPITQTEGCPAVAPAFLEELAEILDNAPKNVLMYIYNGDN